MALLGSDTSVTGPFPKGVLLLETLTGTEELGTPYVFQLGLLSKDPIIDPDDVLGKPLAVGIDLGTGESRYFHGVVTSFEKTGTTRLHTRYAARLSPLLSEFNHTSDCRIFNHPSQDAVSIVTAVLGERGLPDLESGSIKDHVYRAREYCVQYRESDLHFIQRLLEEEGIYYFFRHEEGKHTMVLSDSISGHETAAGYETVLYTPEEREAAGEEEHFWGMKVRKALYPGRHTVLSGYDASKMRPKQLQFGEEASNEPAPGTEFEHYDYPGGLFDPQEASGEATVRTQAAHVNKTVIEVEGNTVGLGVGNLVTLRPSLDGGEEVFPFWNAEDFGKQYLIVGASYSISIDQFETGTVAGSDEPFKATYLLQGSQAPFRPRQTVKKPRMGGPQTALVVGPAGEEIWTDNLGRVRVQFDWDRLGGHNEKSTCWVRVAQTWAGARWGALHIPRIGQEVIVRFLDGDPDRPIIAGSLYSADNMPPYELPANQTQSGIKSRSTKGGAASNFNEIRFEDKKGAEELHVQAEKDMSTLVKHCQELRVGVNRSIVVGNDETNLVKNDRQTTVNLKDDDEVSDDAHDSEVIGGNHDKTVTGTVFQVYADDHSRKVDGDQELFAEKNKNEHVKLAYKLTTDKKFQLIQQATSMTFKGTNVTLDSAGEITMLAGGATVAVEKTGMTTFDSPTGIKLVCGGSALSILPGGIAVAAPVVTAAAGAGSTMAMGEETVAIKSNKVTIEAEGVCKIRGKSKLKLQESDKVKGKKGASSQSQQAEKDTAKGPAPVSSARSADENAAEPSQKAEDTLSVDRVRLVGMLFDLDKCFLLPSAMRGIREIRKQYDAHPDANLLVIGHTDTSGKDAYNLTLSLERAKAIAAYLTDDVPVWDAFFADSKPAQKRWGLLEVQYMLTALPERGTPYFRGTPNGADSQASRAAIKSFQQDKKLEDDGIAGTTTRKELIGAYMALDRTSLPKGTTLTTHGCGENFPAENTGDGKRFAQNRRVEIFFFDGPIEPPVPGPTSPRGSSAYPAWLKKLRKTIDIGLGESSSQASLRSRYALERFEQLAAQLEKNEFVAWASFVYGSDVPLAAYRALYDNLSAKSLSPPEIQLVPGGIDGKDGAYDNQTQMIGVNEDLALNATTNTDAAGELIVVLMHEFGHHIDFLLRNHYSQIGGDAPGEEGTNFAYAITGMHHTRTDHVPFATLTQQSHDTELALDFPEFAQAAQQYLSDPQAREDAKSDAVEYFGPGRGNLKSPHSLYGHQSIEDGLVAADDKFYTEDIRRQIYFGNFLRDYSQINDPGWLRYITSRYTNIVAKAARVLTTELVDVFAHKDFEPTAKPSDHARGDFHVTTAKLGVYRPEEHIDNPEGMSDGRSVDPAFHGRVLSGDPEIALDPNTGIKAYIATPGPYETAAGYIERSLRAALAAGHTPEGRRLFGQGMHTLEDLFAHSNFVELALISLGHKDVFPWVGPTATITVMRNLQPLPRIPMVTGMFGWVDTKVSLTSALAEALEHPIECKAGEFSSVSVAILKLLEAITADGGEGVESLFAKVHELGKKYPDYATALCRATDVPREWIRGKIGTSVQEQVKELQAAETAFFADPRSTAPTHSQLSKDHDDHPLHVIAAQCARTVVTDIGLLMRDAWAGKVAANVLVARALGYIVHPDDIAFQVVPSPGPGQIIEQIRAFADSNPAVIKSLDFATSKARFLAASRTAQAEQLGKANQMVACNDENANRTSELTAMA
jgi:type VI secretion system secreted protein VgrG